MKDHVNFLDEQNLNSQKEVLELKRNLKDKYLEVENLLRDLEKSNEINHKLY